MLIELTDWESGEAIFVDPSFISSMRRLPAMVGEPFDDKCVATELGARTRVDTKTDMFLVRETPVEIFEAAKSIR